MVIRKNTRVEMIEKNVLKKFRRRIRQIGGFDHGI